MTREAEGEGEETGVSIAQGKEARKGILEDAAQGRSNNGGKDAGKWRGENEVGQYSSGKSMVVAERSASVITHKRARVRKT